MGHCESIAGLYVFIISVVVSKQFASHKNFANDTVLANLEQKVTYGSVAVALLVSQYLSVSFALKKYAVLFGDHSFLEEYSRLAACLCYILYSLSHKLPIV